MTWARLVGASGGEKGDVGQVVEGKVREGGEERGGAGSQ